MSSRAISSLIKQIPFMNRTTSIIGVRNSSHRYSKDYKHKYGRRLAMHSLPNRRLPNDFILYESGESPSTELQEAIAKWKNNKSSMRATESNYIDSTRLMIFLEEASEEVQVRKCNRFNVKLHPVNDSKAEFYFLVESADEMKDLHSMSKKSTKFTLKSKNGNSTDGQIVFADSNQIFVELETIAHWDPDEFYDIIFRYNRNFYLLQHQALDFVRRHRLFDLLINNPKYYSTTAENRTDDEQTYELPNVLEKFYLNEEQHDAIVNMIRGDYIPYLLYGPAGTGKTKTLVAAILTILETSNDNILVCTQSNDACDEITVRLAEHTTEDILRMYTPSKDFDEIPKSILSTNANYVDGQLKLPSLNRIYKHRVVICTLAMAGCLTRARCSPVHFSYVIIDECASALEAMALVPIAGLCTEVDRVCSKIILAGDPKQLDAVTISETAEELGYSTSFLEHLFNCPLYKRDAVSGQFNGKYITQLVKNYRSHPAILHVSNQLFYEGTLKAEVAPQITDLNVHLPKLNPVFPVIFKSVHGHCVTPDDDTSRYNIEEVTEVMAYIRTILHSTDQVNQSDVGVISPYRLQCEYIRLMCKRNGFPDITVGTAERFQGQERKIIIASTVCSRSDSVGDFVSDPQRLNVMLTRAQYLLIVVGDPHTLNTNPHWHEFIKYCYTNGSFIQCDDNHFMLSNGSVDV